MKKAVLLAVVLSAGILSAGGKAKSREGPAVHVEPRARYVSPGGSEPFEVTRHIIPIGAIRGGGPPRDGIPALSQPSFLTAADADLQLRPDDAVLGVSFGGIAKAYPVRILNWHEIVNDSVGGKSVAVTW